MYLVRVENGKEVDWKDVFGVCPRSSKPSSTTIKGTDKVIANAKGYKTTYRLYAQSGGGGGHRLYVYWTKVEVKGVKAAPAPAPAPAPAAVIKQSKDFSFGRKSIYRSTETKYKLGEFTVNFKPKTAKITTSWTDQGWGYKKGRMYMTRVDPTTGKEVDWKDVFGVCQRNPQTQTAYVKDTDKIFANAKEGVPTKYRLYGKSSGGGGHRLYVRWIKVNIKN